MNPLNFFKAGQAIVEQLEKVVNAGVYDEDKVTVFMLRSDLLRELAAVKLPAIAVCYRDYDVRQTTTSAKQATITQHWDVVVIVKDVQEMSTGIAALDDVDTILTKVFNALMGFRSPAAFIEPMTLAKPKFPLEDYQGQTIFPTSWTITKFLTVATA